MRPRRDRRFRALGLVLIAVALLLVGLAFRIRDYPERPRQGQLVPTAGELKLLFGFASICLLCLFAGFAGIACGVLRVIFRVKKASRQQVQELRDGTNESVELQSNGGDE
jgi:hypothetical protein